MSEMLGLKRREEVQAPRMLAEELAPELSITALNRNMTQRKSPGHFHSAWSHVEYSLNQSIDLDRDMRCQYIDDAQVLLGWVIKNPEATEDARLGALTLSSYMPCMVKGAHRERITGDDCLEVYNSLGQAIQYMKPLNPGDPPQWRMTETAVLAASARMGQPDLLLYPTSPREESSRIASENHDSYFLVGGVKRPIQQKMDFTSKGYDDAITLLAFQPMMERAYRRYKLDMPGDVAEQLNQLLSLIACESSGLELDRDERNFLNHVSRSVAYHRFKAGDRLTSGVSNSKAA